MKHCVEVERWRGPPHVNKVKQYELCLFIQFSLLIKNILLLNKVFLLLLLISFWTGHYILTTWALSVPLQVPGPQVGPPRPSVGSRGRCGRAVSSTYFRIRKNTPSDISEFWRRRKSVSSDCRGGRRGPEGPAPGCFDSDCGFFFFSQLRKVLEPTRPDRA